MGVETKGVRSIIFFVGSKLALEQAIQLRGT